jgi:pimeloyl-ACP methyl ester carboxylesterase
MSRTTIDVRGVRLSALIEGTEAGPWVTFGHSLATDAALFDEQAKELGGRYRTLRFDMRGHGRSDAPPRPYALADLVGDVVGLWDALGVERSHFVGLSIGGLFAARAWLEDAPAEGLVLINTLRKPGLALDWINEAIARAAALGGQQLVMDMFLPMLVGPKKLAELRPDCLKDTPYEPFPPDAGPLRLLRDSASADWDLPYEQLNLPVLVLTGLRDRIFLDRGAVAELIDRMPDARQSEFPELGHLLPAEDGAAVSRELSAFASGIGDAR